MWPEGLYCIISTLLILLRSFLWPTVLFILVNVSCSLKKNAFCYAGWSSMEVSIVVIQLADGVEYILTDFLPTECLFPYRVILKSPTTIVYFSYFYMLVYRLLSNLIWCSVVRHIHIKDCYVFLEILLLFHYMRLLFMIILLFWDLFYMKLI